MHTPVNGVETRKTQARAALSALGALSRALGLSIVLALPTALAAAPAAAEGRATDPAAKDIDGLWIPAFSIASGVTFQQQEASVESRDVTNDVQLRDPDDGRDWAVTPYLGIDLELSSPVVASIPGNPRFFVNAELLPSFGASLDIAREGDPKGFDPPDGNLAPPECPFGFGCFDQEAVAGVGSRTTAQVDTLSYAAHAGVSFPLELYGRQLHVKPSIGWYRYSVKVDGRVLSALKPSSVVPDVRYITLEDKDDITLDGIGPGLELELDVGRFGPLAPSLYIEGHAYRIFTDRKVKLSASSGLLSCPPPPDSTGFCGSLLPPAEYQAKWSFKADPWIYRGGVGMRFRWIGF